MEFMLDTANLKDIEKYAKIIPIAGVTSNPSIIKKEGKIIFFEHMQAIRQIIGKDASLHVQVVGTDYDAILADATKILEKIDNDVYIKIPVNEPGLQAIQYLKKQGVNITATAIYSEIQGHLAMTAGADYIAPYYNRMENLNTSAIEVIANMRQQIDLAESQTKILAASFKNIAQINSAYKNGAHCATIGIDIVSQFFANPSISKAVKDFSNDWEVNFEEYKTIAEL